MYNNKFNQNNSTKKTFEEHKPYVCGDKVKTSIAYQIKSKDGKWFKLMLHIIFESNKTYDQCIALSKTEFGAVELVETEN